MEDVMDTLITDEQPDVTTQHDYFGFQQFEDHYLPDGISYFRIQAMNEGLKSKFQKMTQRDLTLEKGTGNAKLRMDPAVERHELIKACVVDWNLSRGGQPVKFGEAAMRDFLSLADPKVVEGLELAIRKLNPWLLNEITVEEIDKQIEELQEMRVVALEREAGEGYSSSK